MWRVCVDMDANLTYMEKAQVYFPKAELEAQRATSFSIMRWERVSSNSHKIPSATAAIPAMTNSTDDNSKAMPMNSLASPAFTPSTACAPML